MTFTVHAYRDGAWRELSTREAEPLTLRLQINEPSSLTYPNGKELLPPWRVRHQGTLIATRMSEPL